MKLLKNITGGMIGFCYWCFLYLGWSLRVGEHANDYVNMFN